MDLWILYGEDTESAADLAFETRRFISEGKKLGIGVHVYKPDQFDLLVTKDDRESILIDGNPTALPDCFLPYLDPESRGYFPLAIVRQMARLGVQVFNRASTIETVADKLHTHQILAETGLPTPATMLAKFPVDIDLIESTIGFPVVVKTLLGSNGSGVFLIENREAFLDLMELIGETNPNIQLIFQQYVSASKGRDVRLFVVDGKVIASMERRAQGDGFKANYSQGGSVLPFEPDETARELAIKTAEVLNIQVAGIDLLFTDDGKYTICEANTFPGFKGLEKACDVNVAKAVLEAMVKKNQEISGGGSESGDFNKQARSEAPADKSYAAQTK